MRASSAGRRGTSGNYAGVTYGKSNGPGPLHILKADGTAYCGVKRVHAVGGRSYAGSDQVVHRRCELAYKAALDAIPPRSQEEIDAARRAFRAEVNDALWRFGVIL